MTRWNFPEGFLWGFATSSYQIDGAPEAEGKGPSIWDEFCERPGAIANGDTGRRACDHYHRVDEDLDLLARLGARAYRFSIAWPRVFPEGRGRLNEPGLDFYDRLVDGLLARGIEPMATCYHWDLPLALEKEGGWRARRVAEDFAAYSGALARRLGDRVALWATINEPTVVALLGYKFGIHAPGACEPEKTVRQVFHHLHLGHGLAVQAIRAAASRPVRVGLVHNPDNSFPFFEEEEEIRRAGDWFEERNAWILGPVFHGAYPEKQWAGFGPDAPDTRPGDLEIIATPTDFLGLNVYAASHTVHARHGALALESWYPRTDFDWPLTPDCLYWAVRFTSERFTGALDLYITENGCCYPDQRNKEGRVDDLARVNYLREYLRALQRAAAEGLPARGYFAWSFLDNFEWAEGYRKRFGLAHVNFETLERTPKASAEWYSRVIRRNGL